MRTSLAGTRLSVLLVEDDEDDVLLTTALLREVGTTEYVVDWAQTLEQAQERLARGPHDVYLVDYRLGRHTGLDVARMILACDQAGPVIMLTGLSQHEIDVQAAELGIADYLIKSAIDAATLERSIRYAVTHQSALHALAESEERYALAMAGASDGLWDWDLRTDRLYLSARWRAQLGYGPGDLGERSAEWLALVHPNDRTAVEQALKAHFEGRSAHFESEHRVRARDGRYQWMLARGLAVRGVDGRPSRIAGSQTDITDRKRAESQLQHDALHDALTGLPNRVLFLDRLEHAMRRDIRRPRHAWTAVLFLDLDRFKIVNDSLGHLVGDHLLVEVARRLELALRPGDTVARLGGDEFTVLLEELSDRGEAEAVADRMLATLTEPFEIAEREIYLSASIGIAMAGRGAQPGEVIRDADAAMYRAKAEGKGRHAMFDSRLHEAAVARLELETRLRRGLAVDRINGLGLRVAYQPIIATADGRLTGFEALARWQDGDGRILSPDQFVPVAEETGLIYALGRLVLRESCRQLAQWRERPGASDLRVNVNISGRQLLEPAFVEEIAAVLQEHRLPPASLRLEITETEAASDYTAVRNALQAICERTGVKANLDDFGTGTSSLTFLRGFPGDALKIDRSFVLAMRSDEGAFQIVKAILGLAHNLNMEVVAEGVETAWHLSTLRELECDFAQGFLVAKPLMPDDAGALLDHGAISTVD